PARPPPRTVDARPSRGLALVCGPPLRRQCCQGLGVPWPMRGRYHKPPSDLTLSFPRRPSVMDDPAFSAAVLAKLPLADAVWRLLHFTMADAWLEDLWRRHRGRGYEQDLKFSTLAHLIADALLEHGGSGRQAF